MRGWLAGFAVCDGELGFATSHPVKVTAVVLIKVIEKLAGGRGRRMDTNAPIVLLLCFDAPLTRIVEWACWGHCTQYEQYSGTVERIEVRIPPTLFVLISTPFSMGALCIVLIRL